MTPEPLLITFVLRFVLAPLQGGRDGNPAGGAWRGVARHVQSDTEQHFLNWEDAVSFIEQYVSLDREGPGGRGERPGAG